jgi:DNA mismatch endonuclease (patch repair protein)
MTRNPEITSRIMAAVKGTGTRPEMALRRELHRRGLRYRVSSKLVGKPDVVFSSARVACFVDGDRWHGNGWRLRRYASFDEEFEHANSEFWKQKIARNVERDKQVTQLLTEAGWKVVRIWASDVERDVEAVADSVEGVVRARQDRQARRASR